MDKSASKRNSIISVCLFIVIFAGLLITATFTDMQVSERLVRLEPGQYFTTNTFGAVFASIGSTPTYIFLSIACAIIFSNTKRSNNKFLRIPGSILANLISIGAMVYVVQDVVHYLKKHYGNDIVFDKIFIKIAFMIAAAAIAELICLYFSKLDDKTAAALLKWSFVIIFASALSNALINLLVKDIMCRPRYRSMWILDNFNLYKSWYQKSDMPAYDNPTYSALANFFAKDGAKAVSHFKDGFKSFPSGHTNAAASMYLLLCLPKLLKKYDNIKWKTILLIVSVGFTGLVAVSRIVCGAHFFSDVLVGGTTMFLCVMLGAKIFIKSDFEKV